MSPRPRRSAQIPHLQAAIQETAWAQIAELGAPALSLRAVARALHITAPAIYNYFPSRDDLVTALIVDAYTSLADSQEAALSSRIDASPQAQFVALGMEYRQWALRCPQRYQLIFGTPIPHYHAPEDITNPAASRALLSLMQVIQRLYTLQNTPRPHLAPMTPALEAMLTAWQSAGVPLEREVIYLAVVIWSRVHGLVHLEIGGQFPPYITDPGEIFQREIQSILIQYFEGVYHV